MGQICNQARAVKKIQKNRFKGQGRLEQIRQEIAIMKEMVHACSAALLLADIRVE